LVAHHLQVYGPGKRRNSLGPDADQDEVILVTRTKSRTTPAHQKTFWANPKSLITLGLLAFVALSVIALIAKEVGNTSTAAEPEINSAASTAEDRVVVYYFHGNARCVTCRTIESYAREAVEKSFPSQLSNGSMEFRVVNVETPNTVHFIQDYQLYAPSVVVARFENNAQADWKNLDKVWRLTGDKNAFVTYIQEETTAILQGSG
jgi:hypothetical protein